MSKPREGLFNLMAKQNDLLKGFSEDSVKAVRELTGLLMGAVPTELMKFIRQPHTGSPAELLRTLYNSLTPEKQDAIRDRDRKLLFTDLTLDQQVYLKQVFYQMWMWEIANRIAHPPFYVTALEECRFFLGGEPGNMETVMKMRRETPRPDDTDFKGYHYAFGV